MSKIILFSIVSIVVIIIFIQLRKKKVVKIPADKLNVESLSKALDDDLKAEISVETEKIIAEAIIDDLENEATEALPETLTPSIGNIELSEEDSEELESLLSDEFVSLGGFLGMAIPSVKKRVKNSESAIEKEEKNEERREASLEVIKKNIVKDETKKLNEQVEFLDVQIENVEKERSEKKKEVAKKIKEIESVELKKAKDVQVKGIKDKIERLKNNVEIEDIDLKKKSEKLVKLSDDKKAESSDKSKLLDKVKNIKHPRKSKKGKVKSQKIPKSDGSVSFKLEVPSDINPEEVDEIEIEISEEASKTLEKFKEIKSRITTDRSLDNVSEDDKDVIRSAGKEFNKIKKSYVGKRAEKIRKRVSKKNS